MKQLFTILFLILSNSVQAMPNPQYVPLDNTVQFGKYVEENMTEIIDTSVDLAKRAVANRSYFLITKKIELTTYDQNVEAGDGPFATLNMDSGNSALGLTCKRDIFVQVESDQWGENRKLTFSLSPTIQCK